MPDTPLNYNLVAPSQIVFGWGRRSEVGALSAQLGRRAFVFCGSRTLDAQGRLDELETLLEQHRLAVERVPCPSREPLVEDVDQAAAALHAAGAGPGDFILALGGGSAIDLAKAAAAMASHRDGDSVLDYLEGVGRGLTLSQKPLPVLAMPTTAGTGSEATKNAVLSGAIDRDGRRVPFKKSLRHAAMVPRIVLIDPELHVSLPPHVTAHAGLDAFTQLIESYISRRAQPIPRALALEGLQRARHALLEAYREPHSRPAREAMAHAALLSGMALANSGLGLAHGVAAALGVHGDVPHGLACAVMLPVALRVNREVRLDDLATLGEVLTGRSFDEATFAADALLEFVEQLGAELSIPKRLGELGIRREQLPDLVGGSRGNSMNGNPRELPDEELHALLESLL